MGSSVKTSFTIPLLAVTLCVPTGCRVEQHPLAYHSTAGVLYAAPPPPPPPPPPAPVVMAAAVPVAQPIPAAPAASINTPADVPPTPEQEQPEPLTRGPVHEAFAQPVTLQDKQECLTASQPPATPTENPPADRPIDAAYIWVPGYWSWDAEREGYIWVSGCWRLPPPRMAWVPGYWLAVTAGWQWVPGFWAPASAQEMVYLPAPPLVTDTQPPGAAPSADEFWVPGCWYWTQGRYVFRAGYWLRTHPGWVWSPSCYAGTPRGYVFVEGHWDYALERRGVLFAPVYFPARLHTGVSLTFSPSITLNIGLLTTSLFACPRYTHYYFGDYYDDAYIRVGIYPWFDCVRVGTWYDPVFIYARWDHGRRNPHWEEHLRQEHTRRHDDHDRRPPRTYREQETRNARLPATERRHNQMAQPLKDASPNSPIKFEHADTPTRAKAQRQSEEAHNFREARSRWEAGKPATPEAPTAPASPTTPGSARKDRQPHDDRTPAVTAPAAPTTPGSARKERQPHDDRTPAVTAPASPTTPGSARKERQPHHDRTPAVTEPASPTTPGSARKERQPHDDRTPAVTAPAVTPATPEQAPSTPVTKRDSKMGTSQTSAESPVTRTDRRQVTRGSTAPDTDGARVAAPYPTQPDRVRIPTYIRTPTPASGTTTRTPTPASGTTTRTPTPASGTTTRARSRDNAEQSDTRDEAAENPHHSR